MAWLTLGWTLLVVAYGAFVRASKSGDGCGAHWPACNGELVPVEPTLRTLIEFTHRVTSGLALLLTVALVWVAFRGAARGQPARLGAVLSLAFMLSEALVGAVLVKTGWVASNESLGRAVVMSVHLVNTFLLIAALTLTAFWAHGGPRLGLRGQGATGILLLGALSALLLLGVSGAIAALGDTLFPAASLGEGLARYPSPAAQLLLPLRLLHPLIALLVGALILAGAWSAVARSGGEPVIKRAAILVVALLAVQLGAGLLNVALMAPVWLQLVHLVIADALWMALLWLTALTFSSVPVAAAEQATERSAAAA